MRYIVFHVVANGEIVGGDEYPDGTPDATIDADLPADCAWLEGDADPDSDYILAGVITERPDFGALDRYTVDADGDPVTLFTMPADTVVTYRGVEYTGGGADFIFSSTRFGVFEFLLQPEFPYQPTVILVEANAI